MRRWLVTASDGNGRKVIRLVEAERIGDAIMFAPFVFRGWEATRIVAELVEIHEIDPPE